MKNSKLLLFILFLILVADLTQGQTWEFVGGPQGIYPNDQIFLKDGRILCSTEEGVFISDDSEENWTKGNVSKDFGAVYSLTERKNGEIIAIARNGIIKSFDKGINWSLVSNNSSLNDYGVRIFESPIDSSLYFNKGKILYKSNDDGYNWESIWTGEIIDGFTINDSGWIYLGVRYRNIKISKDNGTTFKRLPIPYDFSNTTISLLYPDKHGGLYFKTDNEIIHFYKKYNFFLIRNYHWTDIPLGVTSNGDLIFKYDNCIALYEYTTKQTRTLSCPGFVKDQFAKNVVIFGNTWIANFKYFGLYISYNGGRTWKDLNTGLAYKQSIAIEITDNDKLLVSTFDGGFWGSLYSSNDDGKTWLRKNPPLDPVFNEIVRLNNGNLVAAGSYGIYTSKNEGVDWKRKINFDIASSLFVSKNGIVYSGNNSKGIWISRDNANTWSSTSGIEDRYFSAFGESSEGRIFASSWYNDEGFYYSDNEGISWSLVTPSELSYRRIYDFIGKDDTLLAATPNGIYYSIDNGIEWNKISNIHNSCEKFSDAPNNELIAISPGNGVLRSTNSISKWESLGEGLNNRKVLDICFDKNNRLFAVTDSGIFRNDYYLNPFLISPVYAADKQPFNIELLWNGVNIANYYEVILSPDSSFNTNTRIISTPTNSVVVNSLTPNTTYYWQVKAFTVK
ncbi:hypothetical protein MNBD_IGNAVI01-1009, partial [hydrothermal vent metagenome]